MYALPELGALQIDYTLVIRGLVLFQLFPLVMALLFHQWRPYASKRIVRPVEIATNILMIIMIAYGLFSQFIRIRELSLFVVTGMVILFLSSLAMGWVSGEKNTASRKTMGLTAAIRNTGIAMIIAIDNFPGTVTVVVVILWGLIMMIMGLMTIMLFKRIANKY
jgi:predicted Na+-dependent transporter